MLLRPTPVLVWLVLLGGTPAAHGLTIGAGPRSHTSPGDDDGKDRWSKARSLAGNGRKFVFIHLEKTAGTFLRRLFKNMVSAEDFLSYHDWHPITDVPADAFVVSSMRNPCEQAVSQWTYSCEETYRKEVLHVRDPECDQAGNRQDLFYAGACPKYEARAPQNGTRPGIQVVDPNQGAFALVARAQPWTFEDMVNSTFRSIGIDRVDCWVDFNNLRDGAEQCLARYVRASGRSVSMSAFEHVYSNTPSHASSHSQCTQYYSDETRALMRARTSFLFQRFGFKDCCEEPA